MPVITEVDTLQSIPASPEVIVSAEDKIVAMKNERRDDTLSVIPLSEKNIKLKIFDNGITDGDSISILF